VRIVTGASSNHARPLLRLLESISQHEPATPVVAWDLGLSDEERAMVSSQPGVELRTFRFENYPAHVRNLQCFAWKPLLIREVLQEGEALLWLDAGDLVHERLDGVRSELVRRGLYTPFGWGGPSIRFGTSKITLQRMGAAEAVVRKRFRHGAVVALAPSRMDLAERWAAYALDAETICPAGASRRNHHFDQSILSVLAYEVADREGWLLEGRPLGLSYCNDTRLRLIFEGGEARCVPVEAP
jgi:hypothetical protein